MKVLLYPNDPDKPGPSETAVEHEVTTPEELAALLNKYDEPPYVITLDYRDGGLFVWQCHYRNL